METKKIVKHTPGPWAVDGFDITSVIHKNNLGAHVHIASCAYGDTTMHPGKIDYVPLDNANARLVAAAPDLLEAVRMAQTNYHFSGPCTEKYRCAYCVAIVKATGERQ